MVAVGNSNVRRGMSFRGAIAGYLEASGLPVTSYKRTGQSISDVLKDESWEHGDLRGLPDWLVDTRVGGLANAPAASAEARQEADLDKKKYAATIFENRGKKVGQALVILSLSDFSDLLFSIQQQQEATS